MAGYGFNIGLDGHRINPLTEKEAEEIAEGLSFIYDNARERMLSSVARRLSAGRIGYGWAERKASEVLAAHAQLEQDLNRARAQRTSLLSGVMERAYVTGNRQFLSDMRSVLGATAHISPNGIKAGYILADLNNSLNAAERRILRQFDDRYADVIGAVSAEMATGVMNTRQAVGEALQRFSDQGITGFIDRGGHHWQLENYAEMAVLTAIERSTISGYVDTMESYGYDLAVIDGHIGSCPICEAWEGVIISVSGNNSDYPSLDEAEGAGCFHPRCLHGIHAYYPGITHEPKGGFRDEPREVQPPSTSYTARSKLRYAERMAKKYRDRALVAQTPQQKAQAKARAQEWWEAAQEQKSLLFASTSGNMESKAANDPSHVRIPNADLPNGLPLDAKPNSVYDKLDENGRVLQRRLYGGDGRAMIDFDTTDHGRPDLHPTGAHKHSFDYSKKNPHGPPYGLTDAELQENADIIQRGVNYHDP